MSEVIKLSIVPEPPENKPDQPAKKLTVGEQLAWARTQQDLSVEQIAGQLKWSPRQITEIEAGNYTVFPDLITVRGIVRTYAKILKIDSAALLQELTNEIEKLPGKPADRPKLDMPFPAGRMPILGKHSNNSQKIIGGLILVFLCLVGLFVYRTELASFVRGFYTPGAEKVVEQPDVVSADKNSQTGVQDVQPEVAQKLVPGLTDNGNEKNSTTGPSDPVGISPASNAGPTQAERADVPLSQALALSFKQDSWVQIKRLNGSVVTSRIYKAGSEEVIAVNEPLNLVFGNAPGVEAKLRGQNLVLPAQPGNNVASISVK
ncbi:cytoskeleton protein RodZ [Oxalobacteraceae bacterium GrIS 2.11]